MGPWGGTQACEAGVLTNARSCLPIACVRPSRCSRPSARWEAGAGPGAPLWRLVVCSGASAHLPLGPSFAVGPTSQSLGTQGQSVRQDPTLLPTVTWKLGFAQAQRKVSADQRPTWQLRCSHWRTGVRKELLHL